MAQLNRKKTSSSVTVTRSVAALKKAKRYVVTSAQTIIVMEAGWTAWIDSTTVSFAIPIRASSSTCQLLFVAVWWYSMSLVGIQASIWLTGPTLHHTPEEYGYGMDAEKYMLRDADVNNEGYRWEFWKWHLLTKELTVILLHFISNQSCVYFLSSAVIHVTWR